MMQLEIKNLSFSYEKNQQILHNVSVSFQNGSDDQTSLPTAIIGQNGAGKSTLVKLLKGLIKPDQGQILQDNQAISTQSVAEIARQIGMVFQNPNDQIFKNTVSAELEFGMKNLGFDKMKIRENVAFVAELFSLNDVLDKNPYDLSLSTRKLITVASVMAMDPKIIIFDEPTIAQDLRGKKALSKAIKLLSEQGKIVISILHDMEFVYDNFPRVIVMNEGEILADDTRERIFDDEALIKKAGLDTPVAVKIAKLKK
ncbi:energy-coupling factor ABC transporter ATP-binding protein [Lactococcus insecticola]|uniref:ABC transporter ATP-binding protein n=1 Tax=Pseudolactococcus insecticola TaxID=2709158 RepID=A0A6A0B6T9_9LACT|nr:ABC transporter ATP-binding protein [Lactococcus insecticola]GFH40475.1 ABC transporter ATP-binding protein [Lactococcus insecticola]